MFLVQGRTGKAVMLQSMGSQRVRCNWVTNSNNKGLSASFISSCLPACHIYTDNPQCLSPSFLIYWGSNSLATWWEKLTYWERLMLRKIEGRRRRGRQRMRWSDSISRWSTWIWAFSGSWWWTGRPGMLQSMGLQRVGHDWGTELNFLIYT